MLQGHRLTNSSTIFGCLRADKRSFISFLRLVPHPTQVIQVFSIGNGNGRAGAIVALVLGLIGMVLSVVHLGSSTGGFGTGSGRAGAIVALVLGLIGMNLGGLALARSRRSRSTD
jgi:hypothetical protein